MEQHIFELADRLSELKDKHAEAKAEAAALSGAKGKNVRKSAPMDLAGMTKAGKTGG